MYDHGAHLLAIGNEFLDLPAIPEHLLAGIDRSGALLALDDHGISAAVFQQDIDAAAISDLRLRRTEA